jgi:hypothetical protein
VDADGEALSGPVYTTQDPRKLFCVLTKPAPWFSQALTAVLESTKMTPSQPRAAAARRILLSASSALVSERIWRTSTSPARRRGASDGC